MIIIFSDDIVYELNIKLRELAAVSVFFTIDKYIQHGDTSCLWHSIAVAYYSLFLARLLHISCDKNSLLVGALLHDYFLYDWHVKEKSHKLHGFRHPKAALNNAERIKQLNTIETDIIIKHMFPLTPVPPIYKESMVVCLVDKFCSLHETFHKDTYNSLKRKIDI
ncbi:HD domain-containing protein [Anaerocolumna sp. MB42-C2]|uniref:HD domain-containing protein n=1 Tax=Anaerocolumna sp. MB42-C2 TaxID=3070997 RepID=UPI0027E1E9F5|nr:HD domain-containing protein [Anaerocolumna sp. MB42-C2]WMJ89744.1 phosphohydrolase [Anaerocolumna sp. MB42-C2]